jgi:hypothetical protein
VAEAASSLKRRDGNESKKPYPLNRYLMYVKSALCQESGVCTSLVPLDIVAVKESIFANFVFLVFCDFEHRVILFSAKLVFNAVLSDILFHND